MKTIKILLVFVFGAILLHGCDTRKLKEQILPAPAAKQQYPDSLVFDITKSGDTISSFSSTKFGDFALKISTVGTGNYNGLTYHTQFRIINAVSGYITSAAGEVTDTMLVAGVYHSFKYYPSTAGWHYIEIAVSTGGGKIVKDTIRYFNETFQSIPYTVTGPGYLGVMRPTEIKDCSITLNSSDLSQQMVYELVSYSLSTIPGQPAGQAKLTLSDGTTQVGQNEVLLYGVNNWKVVLSNHVNSSGVTLTLVVKDENNEQKTLTVTFDVVANLSPIITNATVNLTRNCTSYTNVLSGCITCTNIVVGNTVYVRPKTSTCTYTISLDITAAADQNTGHINDGISEYLVTFYSLGESQTITSTTLNKNYTKVFTLNGNCNSGSKSFSCSRNGGCAGAQYTTANLQYTMSFTGTAPGNTSLIGIKAKDNEGLYGTEYFLNVPASPSTTVEP